MLNSSMSAFWNSDYKRVRKVKGNGGGVTIMIY